MEVAISLITELGPWGLLALCAILGSSGVIALVLVLWWLPRFVRQLLAAFKDQIDAERMHHANTIRAFGSRLDRIEGKIDALQPCRPKLYEIDPDPGDTAA